MKEEAIEDSEMGETSEDDEGEDHGEAAWNEKELDEEVDQIELFVEVAKGNSYQVKGKSVGVDILTWPSLSPWWLATPAPWGQRRNEGWKIPGFSRALEVFGKPYDGSIDSESFLGWNQDHLTEAIYRM